MRWAVDFLQGLRISLTFIFGCIPATLIAGFVGLMIFSKFDLSLGWIVAGALFGTLGLWGALTPIRGFRPFLSVALIAGLATAWQVREWFPYVLFPIYSAALNLVWMVLAMLWRGCSGRLPARQVT